MSSILKILPEYIIIEIISNCDQVSKFKLLTTNKKFYELTISELYKNVLFLIKPVDNKLQKFNALELVNCSVLSNRRSLKRFFKNFAKSRFNYNRTLILTNLIKRFQIVLLKNEIKNLEICSNLDLNQYQNDCMMNYFNTQLNDLNEHDSIKYPKSILVGIFKLLPKLRDSLEDLNIPIKVYSKLITNVKNHDFLKNRETKLFEMIKPPSSSSCFVKKLFNLFNKIDEDVMIGKLNLYHIGLCLNLTLANLSSFAISMSDLVIARKALSCCDFSKLKKLSIYHLGCLDNEKFNLLYEKEQKYEIERQFALIDEFFKNANIVNIFKNLEVLNVGLHNGYNRMIFKKFLFDVYYLVIGKDDLLLNLKEFSIIETVTNIEEIEKSYKFKELFSISKKNYQNVSSLIMMIDLFKTSKQFNIKDVISFKSLKKFNLKLGSFMIDEEYQKLINYIHHEILNLSKQQKHFKFQLTIQDYDQQELQKTITNRNPTRIH